MCPHTPIYVSSYSYICVLILLYMCPHTPIYVSSYSYICVLILLYMCPHTAIYVSSYCYICVLILLYMCPHTLILLGETRERTPQQPDTAICVLILLYMCPHTAMYVSSYTHIARGNTWKNASTKPFSASSYYYYTCGLILASAY
jgi:hypothetical protein